MPLYEPDLYKIIDDLQRRIKALELGQFTYGTMPADAAATLTISGLAATVSYINDSLGNPIVNVAWGWSTINNPDDPVVDYFVSATDSINTGVAPYFSSNNTNGFTTKGLINTSQTLRVYAMTTGGSKGPVASLTVALSQDSTPPPQPSTPVTQAQPRMVLVSYDGKTSTGTAMPSDFKYVEVHYVVGNNPAFTPTISTYYDKLFVHQTTSISTDQQISIRLIAVDTSGNKSGASTASVVTPVKLVSTDLDIVLPGSLGYSDTDNMLIDGSFENATYRAIRTLKVGTWTFQTTQTITGSYGLQVIGDATATKYLYLHHESYSQQLIPITLSYNSKIYIALRAKSVSANGTVVVLFDWLDNAGTVLSSIATINKADTTGNFVLFESVVAPPTGAIKARVSIQTLGHTTGTWYFDNVVVKNVVSSVLIEDGAITNAKIGQAAITSANVEELSAGLISSGFLDSARIQASSITANKLVVGIGTQLDISNNISVSSLNEDVSILNNTVVVDENGVSISKQGSPFQITIDNSNINFKQGGSVIAYVNGQKLYISTAQIMNSLIVGVHEVLKYDNNHTMIRWVG